MTKAFWFWFFMAIWLLLGSKVIYGNRSALAPLYWGIGWSLLLFFILLVVGFELFPDPFGTLVK